MKRVFLGGTCNESTWRDELIPKLILETKADCVVLRVNIGKPNDPY